MDKRLSYLQMTALPGLRVLIRLELSLLLLRLYDPIIVKFWQEY